MISGTGPWRARSAKYLSAFSQSGNEKSAGAPAGRARPRPEHPQRLGLGGLARLEEEAAGRGGQRPEQVGLALAAASADDAERRLRARIGGGDGPGAPLAVAAEDVRGLTENLLHRHRLL